MGGKIARGCDLRLAGVHRPMLAIATLTTLSLAYDGGKTGGSTTGCGGCHGKTASASVTTSFSASATTVAPGDVVTITLSVASTSASHSAGGLDVSADGGTLAAGSNTQLSAGEITHAKPESMSGSQVDFDFTWTAPSTEDTYTFSAAGNAVDEDGTSGGDGWSLATDLEIVVDDGCDDTDGDGYTDCDGDCDESDASVSPGADELCADRVDNDCDGETDEDDAADAGSWYPDEDGDGYGDETATVTACEQPADYTATGGDCDDTDAGISPAATETCDGVDQDCDGTADDDATDAGTYYADLDGDGFGDATNTVASCSLPGGYTTDATDCDDAVAAVNPDGEESCNGRDDDCDGDTDEDDAVDTSTWYADADGDGWGDETVTTAACSAPSGYVAFGGDCDDADPAYNPAASESDCTDDTDYNCDGLSGAIDTDGDGYMACEECDDADAAISPGADEVCDGADNDCDGTADEDDAIDATAWYADTDGDTYGDPADETLSCSRPEGRVADATDCDDADAAVNPGTVEVCNDLDDDCDGDVDGGAADATTWYADADGDGYGDDGDTVVSCDAPDDYAAEGGDCDSVNPAANPGAAETCDERDDDCDGEVDESDARDAPVWYIDADGDGHGSSTATQRACSQPEGYAPAADDCDDADASAYPGAEEIWYDGVDQDCDGNDTDQDGDGAAVDDDCDDEDADRTDDCSELGETGETGDTGGPPSDTGEPAGKAASPGDEGCGCAAGAGATGWPALLLGALVGRRRRARETPPGFPGEARELSRGAVAITPPRTGSSGRTSTRTCPW
jgi:MYXO-CTERM domain-containing protein